MENSEQNFIKIFQLDLMAGWVVFLNSTVAAANLKTLGFGGFEGSFSWETVDGDDKKGKGNWKRKLESNQRAVALV